MAGLEARQQLQVLERRNPAMDIVRITAVFLVICVHFFLNTGFYSETVSGGWMYLMCVMRSLFGACVPLFMILSGYLMCRKQLSRKYYRGIGKILLTYALATVGCNVYKVFYLKQAMTPLDFFLSFFDFTGANYSWYVEMYIGLFLLIPFLNLTYNHLSTKRQKQILILTMVALTVLPTVLNIWKMTDLSFWASPTATKDYTNLVPDWWMGIYPITYYFVGCYLREYGIRLKTPTVAVLLVVSCLLCGALHYCRSVGGKYQTGTYGYWYGFDPFIIATLLFVLLSRIPCQKAPLWLKDLLWRISDLAFGIYLFSYIADSYLYGKLKEEVTGMTNRLAYFPLMVLGVFAASVILSFAAQALGNLLVKAGAVVMAYGKRLKEEQPGTLGLLCFVVLFVFGVAFSIWKCQFGFGGDDEAFYLTVPHRLSLGESLIWDEWHLSQMSGVLTFPFVVLYRTFFGTTEGIMMASRLTYVVLHSGVSLLVYARLRRYHSVMAMVASLLHLIFTPYNIMALSYNTLGMDLLLVAGLLLATGAVQKRIYGILAGCAFAGSVLCCPYLAAVYVLYAVCVAVRWILRRVGVNLAFFQQELFGGRRFAQFTIGVGILAVLFLILLFSRTSLQEIFQAFPYLFTDPEHPQIGWMAKAKGYFKGIYNSHSQFKWALGAFAVQLAAMIMDRNRRNHRSVYLCVSCAIAAFALILFMPEMLSKYYNAILFPFLFVGITAYALCEKKPRELLATVFFGGIIYSFALVMGSNQYFYVICMAISISNLASFMFVGILLKELWERPDEITYSRWLKGAAATCAACLVIFQGALQIGVKMNHCFWETGQTPATLTTQISCGPAKGIYTTQSTATEYEAIYQDLTAYFGKERAPFLALSRRTWMFLAMEDFPYGSFSAWISGEKEGNVERLKKYYALNPDKTPKYIYIPKASSWDLTDLYLGASRAGYNVQEGKAGYYLEKRKY